jgi:four helix bundle protein
MVGEGGGWRMEEIVDKRIMSYRELRVYRVAFQLQQDIFVLSKSFPVEERYSLTDQIRRSSRSIGANIAEAWKKRRYKAHFISKLTDSDAETLETQHWLLTACKCDYISADKYDDLIRQCNVIESMLGKMMMGVEKWVC